MRLVVKNKEEGTELFKGGNYRPAAARYHKALSHSGTYSSSLWHHHSKVLCNSNIIKPDKYDPNIHPLPSPILSFLHQLSSPIPACTQAHPPVTHRHTYTYCSHSHIHAHTHKCVKEKWLWFKYTSKDLSWRKSVQTNIHILSLFLYPSPILPFAFSYSRPHLSWLYNVTACLHNQKVLSLFNPTCPLASTHHSHYNFFRTTAKFFDLAPEDEIELKSLKLNLFLNLASCYIKLENWDQVIILFMRTVMFNKHVQEQVPYPSRTSLSNLTTSLSPCSWGLNMI